MLGNLATGRFSRRARLLLPLAVLVLLFLPTLANAQVVVKVNDNVNFRFGTLIQGWADELQDPTTRGYANNVFLRRVRFIVSGQVAPNVTFFVQTDNPNLGKAPKNFNGTFLIQDAWAEWKITDAFMLDAGEFLIPLNRSLLTSSGANVTLDISPTATVSTGAATQGNGNRDLGFQAKGYVGPEGRLEYRAAVTQGIRDAAARNPYRKTGFLQYDFWEKERGYVWPGTNLGKKRILAIDGGYDTQRGYKAYSTALDLQLPVFKGDEFSTQLMMSHYDGASFVKAVPRQTDLLGEFGYYNGGLKLQPFAKLERVNFDTTTNAATTDLHRIGVGANYYVSGQNLKLTGQLLHTVPANHAIHSSNEATVQLQFSYY